MLIVDGLISATTTATVSATATATATHSSMKEAALRAVSTQGGGGLRPPPPCVDSFMDGCVAVAVPETVTVAETVAAAEINPSTINPSAINQICGFAFGM